jgi:hypothetical protein
MERDFIKQTLKNWREETPDKVKRAVQVAFAKLPASKTRSRRAWTAVIAACLCFMTVMFITPVGGYALAAIQSVFGLFAEDRYANPELNQIVTELDQSAQTPTQQEVDRVGDAQAISAKIDGVFYDGTQLVVSYSIQGRKDFDAAYTPSPEELATMSALESNMALISEGNEDGIAAVREKVAAGQPAGWRAYDVFINDGTYTNDGIDVPASTDDYFYSGDQKVGIRFYNLTDELKQRDTLVLDIGFTVWETSYYFDGSKEYYSSKKCESQTVEVSAIKTAAIQAEGEGTFETYMAQAQLSVSSAFISAKVKLTPVGSASEQKEWLGNYKSEFDIGMNPVSYYILDADGNVIAENAAGGSIVTKGDCAVMELRFAAVKDLPGQLILRPIFVDGMTADNQDIYITLP